jgi:hypothetical protein
VRGVGKTGAVLAALVLSTAGCGAIEYRLQFVNDLSQAVVVEGCKDCADGRQVGPGESVPLKVAQDVIIKVTMTDGAVVGCLYQPSGGSTSDPLPYKASDFKDGVCEASK